MDRNIDNCFQFTTQLFGALFLTGQISWNFYTFICKKVDIDSEKREIKSNDLVEAANDVVLNANGRLIWASWFSLIIVILAVPQIGKIYKLSSFNLLIVQLTTELFLPLHGFPIIFLSNRLFNSMLFFYLLRYSWYSQLIGTRFLIFKFQNSCVQISNLQSLFKLQPNHKSGRIQNRKGTREV